MNVSRMSVAMLKPYSLLYSVIKIFRSNHTKNWHHKLCCDQWVFLRSLKCNTSDVVRNCNSNHSKKCLCITANTFSVQLSACKNYFCKCILLFFRSQVASLLIYQVVHQFVCDRIYCNDLFFCNARKVVIKCTSVYNVLSCLTDICCFINKCRWVTCSSSDSSSS